MQAVAPLMPILLVFGLAVALLILDMLSLSTRKSWLAWVAAVGFILIGIQTLNGMGVDAEAAGMPLWISDLLAFDGMAAFFQLLALLSGALVCLLAVEYVQQRMPHFQGEFFALLAVTVGGIMLAVAAKELLTLYISIELVSITSYILVGYVRGDKPSSEGGLKYLLYGAACSAFMLYGISLIYGLTGTTYLSELQASSNLSPAMFAAAIFMMVGLGFKIALVPFHMWSPDVYEGAPTPITAFLSVTPKLAGFAALLRVFVVGMEHYAPLWLPVFGLLCALTMTIGNVVAIPQRNMKRMLAYSSIAQAGYIFMGIVVAAQDNLALEGVLLYSAAYVAMNLGAFAIVIYVKNALGTEEIADYAGLAQVSPGLALMLVLFLLSLAGIPPLLGFWGKLYVFAAAIQQGYLWLAIIGVLNSVISLYYYFNVTRLMYFVKPSEQLEKAPIRAGWSLNVALAFTLLLTLALGLMPAGLLRAVTFAAQLAGWN